MVPRALGRSGPLVSPIGLGTLKIGRNTDVKFPAPFSLPSETEARALLDAALAMGVTLYDTAPAYGESERRLAPFLAANRGRVVLCTKAGETWSAGRSSYDFSGKAIASSLDASLSRLRVERVDVLLLHSDGRDAEILERTDAVPTMRRLQSQGKARLVGISARTDDGILAARGRVDVVMAPFSSMDPTLSGALAQAHEAGLGILAIKGLNRGRLPGSATDAVRFVLARPFIDCLLVGTLSTAHLAEAIEAAKGAGR